MLTFTQNLFAGKVAEPASKLRSKYQKKSKQYENRHELRVDEPSAQRVG